MGDKERNLVLLAAKAGNGPRLMELLQGGEPVRGEDELDRNAIHYACEKLTAEELVEALPLLFKNAIDEEWNDADKEMNAPLNLLFSRKGINDWSLEHLMAVVGTFVSHKGDLNTGEMEITPLHQAAGKLTGEKLFRVCEAMLTSKSTMRVTPNTKDEDNNTPLMELCDNGDSGEWPIRTLELFLKHKANVKHMADDTALHHICTNYRMDAETMLTMAAALIQAGADPNACDKYGEETPMHQVCDSSSLNVKQALAMIALLAESGADINAVNDNDQTPMHTAYLNESMPAELVDFMIEKGADMGDLFTRVHVLCGCLKIDSEELSKLVKENPAAVNQADCDENGALGVLLQNKLAKGEQIVAACKVLLDEGDADVSHENDIEPLFEAFVGNNSDHLDGHRVAILQMLVDKGGEELFEPCTSISPLVSILGFSHIKEAEMYDMLKICIDAGVECVFDDDSFPLQSACEITHLDEKNTWKVFNLIWDNGGKADVNKCDSSGDTALQRAVTSMRSNSAYVKITRTLLDNGAEADRLNNDKQTPLFDCITAGGDCDLTCKVVELLIEAGATVHETACWKKERTTALNEVLNQDEFSGEGLAKMIQMIVKAGCDVNFKDRHNFTPLTLVCQHKGLDGEHLLNSVRVLIKAGSDVNAKGRGGATPLMMAARAGKIDIIKELVDARADVTLRDMDKRDVLVVAVQADQAESVEALLEAGVNPLQEDADGKTADAYATNKKMVAIIQKAQERASMYRERYLMQSGPKVGGDNMVELAVDKDPLEGGMRVALKFTGNKEDWDREVGWLKKLNNSGFTPNYVEHFEDSARHPDRPYCIVMEAAEEGLRELLDKRCGALARNEIKYIVECVAKCLAGLAARGVAHCDVKPENLMRFLDGYRLIDLDSACDVRKGDLIDSCTPQYAAPEVVAAQVKGKSIKASVKVDTWAFGALLYELETGERLLEEDMVDLERVHEFLTSPQFDYTTSHESANRILKKMLAMRPGARQTVAQLMDADYLKGASTIMLQMRDTQEVHTNMLKEQTNMLKDVMGQVKANAKLVTNLKDADCPRVFCVLPDPSSNKKAWLNPKKAVKSLMTDKLKLHLMCEFGDWHFVEGKSGYKIEKTKDFVKRAAPVLKTSLTVLKMGALVGKAFGIPLPTFDGAKEALDSMVDGFESDMLSSIADSVSEAFEHIPSLDEVAKKSGVKDAAVEAANIKGEPVADNKAANEASGAAFRMLKEFLERADKTGKSWGVEKMVVLATGDVHWYCKEHRALFDKDGNRKPGTTQLRPVLMPIGAAPAAAAAPAPVPAAAPAAAAPAPVPAAAMAPPPGPPPGAAAGVELTPMPVGGGGGGGDAASDERLLAALERLEKQNEKMKAELVKVIKENGGGGCCVVQ